MKSNHSHSGNIMLFSLVFLISITSCNQRNNSTNTSSDSRRHITKPEKPKTISQILDTLNYRGKINHLNLTNLALSDLPDLSKYEIENLDLSHNNLDTIPLSKLPKNLRRLKCTNNRLNSFRSYSIIGEKSKYNNSNLNLEELDLSYNNLKSIHYTIWNYTIPPKRRNESCKLRKVNVSNNQLTYVSININCENLNYLNIGNNPCLSNIFNFDITKIKSVDRENIKNKLPLKMKTFQRPLPVE